jgi:8-oxo-dGTP pyrophosphatase MutT (NUDIX family)
MTMRPVRLEPVPPVVRVRLEECPVILPQALQAAIDAHWHDATRENPRLFRGPAFTVAHVTRTTDTLSVTLRPSDYAHYLYTVRNPLPREHAFRSVYGVGLVRTRDNVLIVGEMGAHSAHPHRLQAVAGGLDRADVGTDGSVDLRGSVLRELHEELGLCGDDADAVEDKTPVWLKSGGPYDFLVIAFRVTLALTGAELLARYTRFEEQLRSQGGVPEFSQLICLPARKDIVARFLLEDARHRVDYLAPLLCREVGMDKPLTRCARGPIR